VCNNATLINDYIDHGGSKELATKDIYDGLAHSAVLEMDACIYEDPADCLMEAKVHFNDANGGTMSDEDFVMLYEESELDSTCAGTCPTTITASTTIVQTPLLPPRRLLPLLTQNYFHTTKHVAIALPNPLPVFCQVSERTPVLLCHPLSTTCKK
jgi:hypothetical protein